MMRLFKLLYWDLKHQQGRFSFLQSMLRDVPGEFGIALRSRLYRKRFAKAGDRLSVAQGVRFRNIQYITVGENVSIGDCCFLQAAGGIELGDHVLLGPGVKIWSANHRTADLTRPIKGQGYEFKKVVIGSDVWIGANAFIMPGAQIGDHVIIAAGSVVGAKPVPAFRILAGNPARVIGTREQQPDSGEPAAGTSDTPAPTGPQELETI